MNANTTPTETVTTRRSLTRARFAPALVVLCALVFALAGGEAPFAQSTEDPFPDEEVEPPWVDEEENGDGADDDAGGGEAEGGGDADSGEADDGDERGDDAEREPTDPAVDPASREAIFGTQLGDADVDLFIVGSWNTGIGGTLGWAFHPEIPPEDNRVTFPYDFPGMEEVPYFNAVDLTISLWLYERYYLEATFADEFEVNSFILGYQGQEGEFLQSIRLGYGLLSISKYPYIPFGEATEPSPGISAAFETQRSDHELLVRYEPSEEQRKIFYGLNEARETRIGPEEYERGRFFVLPDAEVENLTLYLEDDEGNISAAGSRWREADLDSAAVYSAEKGIVYLREKPEARVAVHYTKGGNTVGDPGLGDEALVGATGATADDELSPGDGPGDPPYDFDFGFSDDPFDNDPGTDNYLGVALGELRLTLDGNQSLLLHEPGAFNPFEIAARYDISDLSSAEELETEFVRKGDYSEREIANRNISVNEDQTQLTVGNPNRGVLHHSNRYPFAEDFPELYGPNPTDKDGYTDFEILATGLTPVNRLTIDGNVVPGSVTVLRNGVEDPSFEVDYGNGVVTSPFPIYPNDVIEVVYRVYGSGGGGDLLFASGNRISLGAQTDLTLALGTKWNVLRGAYSEAPTDHPGSVTASAAVEHETDYFSGYIDGAVQLSVPDTTGYLRLLGMEEKETEVPAADGNMFPAAAPGAPEPDGSDPDDDWDDSLSQDNRGRLFYKDFYDETAAGGRVLRDYDWDVPDDKDYPYAAGSRVGPYPAKADDDGVDGQVMVLDFEIDGGRGEEWVGAHLRMPDFTDRDFSEITEISFEWRALDLDLASDDIEVYLQIGALAEDVDGDGTLDRGESTLSPSFDFDDDSAGFRLKAGRPPPGEEYRMSEDGNRNGVLDAENPDLVHTLSDGAGTPKNLVEVDDGSADEEWSRVSFDLDAAARRKLASTRAVRVVVRSTDTVSGRTLFSKFTLRGSTFQTSVDSETSGGSVNATEVPDRGAPKDLVDEHSEVDEVFHAEGDAGQRVLRVDWRNLSGGDDSWSLTDYVTPVPPRQYEVLTFYARSGGLGPDADNTGAGDLTVTLSESGPEDGGGSGSGGASGGGERLRATVPIDEGETEWLEGRWRKVEIDTASGNVYVDGDRVGSVDETPGAGAGKLSRLEVTFSPENEAAEGTIYIDEVHWARTRISLSGASRLSATYEYPDTVVQAGDVEILSDIRVAQETLLRSGGFATDSDVSGGTGSLFTRTELGGEVLYTRLETDFEVAVQDDRTALSGGHSLRIPAAESPVVFTESFRRDYNRPDVSLYRQNELLFSLPMQTNLGLDSDASLRSENLEQNWSFDGVTRPAENYKVGLTLGLGHSAGGYRPGSASYPESWIAGYELLAPYSRGESPERTGEASLSAQREPSPIGFEVETSEGYENRSSTEGEQTNEALLSLAVPLSFNRESSSEWTLTPSYAREFERTTRAPHASSYDEDLGVYGSAFAGQAYLASSVPFAELFQGAGETGFAGASAGEPFTRYTPAAGLAVERSFGSRLRDLVLPSEASLDVSRRFTREEEALTERLSYSAGYTATALNLFGRVGAYPTFELYRTDEFSNSISATIDRRFPSEDTTVSAEASSLAALFGEGGNELSIETTASATFEETRSLTVENETAYLWERPTGGLFEFDRLIDDEPPHFENTERAVLLYDDPGGGDEEQSYSLSLGHETRLVFPDHGFIRLYADVGVGLQPLVIEGEDVNAVLLGLQGGIEGRIEF